MPKDASLDSLPLDDGGTQVLQQADSVLSFPNNHTAIIDPSGETTRSMVESSAPLKPQEGKVPDLSLQQHGDSFVPENPIVPVTLPSTMEGQATLPDVGVGVSVPSATDSTVGASKDVPDSTIDAAVYRGALPDSDVIMAPVGQGLDIATRLDSAQSPEDIPLRLSIPDGAHVDTDSNAANGATIVDASGKKLAAVAPPAAWDATGQAVPSTMAVSGHTLVLHVPHRELTGVQYPVMVDPVLTEDLYWTDPSCNQSAVCAASTNDWSYFTNAPNGPGSGSYYPSFYPWCGQNGLPNIAESCGGEWRGLHVYVPYAYFPTNTWGLFYLHAPGSTTYFTNFWSSIGQGANKPAGYEPRNVVGIVRDNGSWVYQGVQTCNFPTGGACWSEYSIPNSDTNGRILEFGTDTFQNWTTTNTWRFARMTGFRMEETDPEPATVSNPESTLPTGWVGKPALDSHYGSTPADSSWSVKATATDPGLGVHRIIFSVPLPNGTFYKIGWGQQPSGGWSQAFIPTYPATSCSGFAGSRCPGSQIAVVFPDLRSLPSGKVTASVQAFDALGQASAAKSIPIYLDRGAPTGDVGGSLVSEATHGDHLRLDSYGVDVTATDGAAGDQVSGVASVVIKVDGTAVQSFDNPNCSSTGGGPVTCSQSFTAPHYDLSTTSLPDGHHTLTVTAIDEAGNASNAVTPFTLARAVYHATAYTGDPAQGGRPIQEEWFNPGSDRVESDSRVQTRQVVPCATSTAASGSCTELRTATLNPDGTPSTWDSTTSPHGDDPTYSGDGLLGSGLDAPTSELVQSNVAHSSYMEPWQVPPPGAGANADLYRHQDDTVMSRDPGPGPTQGGAALAFWRLGETSGTQASDRSGNGNTGTYVSTGAGNNLNLGVPGALAPTDYDKAVDLNGSSQYVSSNWATRRNLVTNPSFETDTGSWSNWGSPGSWTRSTVHHENGDAALKVGSSPPGFNGVYTSIAATPGKYYSAAAQLLAGNSGQMGLHLCYMNSSAQSLRCDAVSVSPGAYWGRAMINGSSFGPSPAGTARIWLIANNEAITQDFYVDSVQIEQSASISSYFDGSSPNSNWEGATNSSVSTQGPFANGTTRTFEGWANRDTQSGLDFLFGGTASDQSAPEFFLGSSPTTTVYFAPAGNSGSTVTWDNAWPGTGQWVHWDLVFNEAANTAELFINGQSKGVKTVTTQWPTNPSPLLLGAWGGNNGGWTAFDFDGKIDDVAVYDHALDPSEINAHYKAQPALYWRLGEDSGTTASDGSNHGRQGSYVGAPALNVSGAVQPENDDGAVNLNGTSQYISSSYNPFANGTTRTFEGWANRDTETTLDTLVGGQSADQSAPILDLGGEGGHPSGQVTWSPAGPSAPGAVWEGAWPGTGQWVHWALTYDQSAGTAELFVNGDSQGAKSLSTPYPSTPGNLRVGSWGGSNGTQYGFDGQMDEVAVYDRALDPSELESQVGNGKPRTVTTTTEMFVDHTTHLPTTIRARDDAGPWQNIEFSYGPKLSEADLAADFFGQSRPTAPLDDATTIKLYGDQEIGPVVDQETGQPFQPLYFGNNYSRNGQDFCLADGGLVQIDEPADPPYSPDPAIDDYAVASELPPMAWGDETQAFAGYTLPPPGDACQPGSGTRGSYDLQATTINANSTDAKTWLETYRQTVASAGGGAQDPSEPPATRSAVTFRGVSATAYTIPISTTEASTAVSDGNDLVIITGPAETFTTSSSAARLRDAGGDPSVISSITYDIQGLLGGVVPNNPGQ
jgi:hypothetical protein